MRIAVHAFDGITMFHLAAPLLVFGEVGRQCLAAGWGPVVWTRDGRGIRTAEGPRIEDVRGPDAVEDADLVVLPSWPIDLPMTDEPLTARIRATRELAMFPLGSVLFPGMPLQLRVFEPRYVAMLSSLLSGTEREFGVVLIERGSEVGGGDVRLSLIHI